MPSDFFDEFTGADNLEKEAQAFKGQKQQADDDGYDAIDGFDAAFNASISNRMSAMDTKDNPAQDPDDTGKLILGKFKSAQDLERAYQNLERQHTLSRQELAKLEKAKPLIDAITEDEGLYELIDDYFKSPDSERQRKAMGLPEGFQMDMDEAINDPNSDSARVLQRIVESQASKIVEQRENAQRVKENISKQAAELKAKYGLDDDQIQGLVSDAKSVPLTLEDLWILRNKDNLINAARTKGAQSVMAAQKKAKGITPSGARAGTSVTRGKAFIDELLDFDNSNSFRF
jgi:hypothetical protein